MHLIDQRNHGRSFWSTAWLSRNGRRFTELLHRKPFKTSNTSGALGWVLQFLLVYIPVNQLIVATLPKSYPPHHQSILNGLASLDFEIIKSRKEADEQLALHVKEIPTRQFLLKNIYRVTPAQLGYV